MRITGSHFETENDDTPNEETKLYRVIDLSCVNEKCANNGKVVETLRNELDLNG